MRDQFIINHHPESSGEEFRWRVSNVAVGCGWPRVSGCGLWAVPVGYGLVFFVFQSTELISLLIFCNRKIKIGLSVSAANNDIATLSQCGYNVNGTLLVHILRSCCWCANYLAHHVWL